MRSFLFSHMVRSLLLRLCDCRPDTAVPVLSVQINLMSCILTNKSVVFKPELQQSNKEKNQNPEVKPSG